MRSLPPGLLLLLSFQPFIGPVLAATVQVILSRPLSPCQLPERCRCCCGGKKPLKLGLLLWALHIRPTTLHGRKEALFHGFLRVRKA